MKLSKMLFKSLRETPSDIELESHKIMIKSSLIHQAGSGIYSYLPLAWKSLRKIEQIIREEIDNVGGQELRMPVIQPKSLWDKSGRSISMGQELFNLNDRRQKPFVLAPTHEELLTSIVKEMIYSYKSLPQLIYQMQTKLRDEPRPRGGLLRVREFIMKDAYSFDLNKDGLDESYENLSNAYMNIYDRCGLEVIKIEADSGAIGGKDSHEFVAISDAGEDKIVICNNCNYSANSEKASFSKKQYTIDSNLENQEFPTPGIKTIASLCKFAKVESYQTIKAMFYNSKDELICAVIRGDYEINELKLARAIGDPNIKPASNELLKKHDIPAGSASPLGKSIKVIADDSLLKANNYIAGANKEGYHIKNVNIGEDFTASIIEDISQIPDNAQCSKCNKDLSFKKAIEVGHIFKLGTIYSEKFDANYLDINGKSKTIEMGCYGIGTGRLLAAVIEQNHDKNGPIFPKSVSPYDLIISPIKYENKIIKEYSDKIYDLLKSNKFDIVLDDRKESPGVKFSDADLLGFPIRLIISEKLIEQNMIEIKLRNSEESIKIENKKLIDYLKK